MKIKLKNVRLAFPDIFKATAMNEGDKPAFSAAFLIDPTKQPDLVASVNAAIDAVAKEKWGAKAEATLKTLRAANKVAIHDGDTKEYQGYAGMLFINARSATKPAVFDADLTPLTEQSGKPYAGCYVDASIEIYAQDNSYGKRVNASLKGVQFRRDGDAFAGGAPASADDFEDLSVKDETADDLV